MNAVYNHLSEVHNTKSALEVVPLILRITSAKSVLDVGCGNGSWLSIFAKSGLTIFGVDGTFIDESQLLIDNANFAGIDLADEFDLGRRFDVAMSLEVAEHLPAASARGFVRCLTLHSDIIFFSAAAPNQGGQNHVNEQPPGYWVSIFNEFGYVCYDIIRPRLWENESVDWWYRQNMFVAVLKSHSILKGEYFENITMNFVPYVIHPVLYNYRVNMLKDLRVHFALDESDPYDSLKPVITRTGISRFFEKVRRLSSHALHF